MRHQTGPCSQYPRQIPACTPMMHLCFLSHPPTTLIIAPPQTGLEEKVSLVIHGHLTKLLSRHLFLRQRHLTLTCSRPRVKVHGWCFLGSMGLCVIIQTFSNPRLKKVRWKDYGESRSSAEPHEWKLTSSLSLSFFLP